MKKHYLLGVMICAMQFSFAQLTVTTNPASATICAGNSVTITASATPVGYTGAVTTYSPYDPTMYATTELFDQANGISEPLSSGTLDDGRWENIPLPFSFRFYGNVFNTIHITTNGWIGMGSTNTTSTGLNSAIPNGAAPNNVIHAITADLTFAGAVNAAVLQYFEVGTSPNRKFVVDYSNLKFVSGGNTANVQVILNETTNVVEIHTTSCTNTVALKTQGIENGTGTLATAVPSRNNVTSWTGTPNAYKFTPDNITYSWTGAGLNTSSGPTVIATPSVTTTYTVNATNTVNSATGSANVTVTINSASNVLAGTAGGAEISQNISVSPTGTSYRDGNCNLIATILPTGGATAVSNSINTKTKVDTGATKRGTSNLYVARKYDIEPIINPYPATSTADITLYYLQSEFNNYNLKATDSSFKLLPTGAGDATGISNLVLRQFHGTGTNPNNYTGPSVDFTTATAGFTVTYNATRSWWEVKVPVTSFSGFYITSQPAGVLAIGMDYFTGAVAGSKNLLNWKVNCTSAKAIFEIQRSADGQHFATINTSTADKLRCSQPFDGLDEHPLSGLNYYRIKVIDADGSYFYSNTISLMQKTGGFELINISPNPVGKENAVLKVNTGVKATAAITITDFTGRVMNNQTAQLLPGINQVTLNTTKLVSGTYIVTINAPGEAPKATKLVKQ